MTIYLILNLLSIFQLITLIIIIRFRSDWKKTENKFFIAFLSVNTLLIFISSYSLKFPITFFQRDTLTLLSMSLFLLLGPMFYLFIKGIIKPAEDIKRSYLNHSLPSFLVFFAFLISCVYPYRPDALQVTGNVFKISLFFSFSHLLVYILFSLNLLIKYTHNLAKVTARLDTKSIGWLRVLLLLYFIHWLLEVLALILPSVSIITATQSIWFASGSTVFLIIFSTLTVVRGTRGFGIIVEASSPFKYAGLNLSTEEKEHIKAGLLKLIKEEQTFMNPDLSINELASVLNTTIKKLSQVINESFQCNFFDFINKIRIESAKSIILNEVGKNKPMTIQEIYYEVGFNSKSAFNRTFKKNTGCTPTEYRYQIKNSVLTE